MCSQKDRSIEQYMLVGAEMRLFKDIRTQLCVDASRILNVPEMDKLLRAMKKVDTICSYLEERMFQDHPELNIDYTDVFYGSLQLGPRTTVDDEVMKLARSVADDLFKKR